jgi:hypothetical protein
MLFDAGHGGADQSAHRIDRGQSRGSLRTATQTGSETGAFSRRRMRIKTHIFAISRTRRANRPAINMRRGDAYIKMAVKAAIAGPHRAKTSIRIEFHGATLAPIKAKYSPFSDLDIASRAREGLSLSLVLSFAPLSQRSLE